MKTKQKLWILSFMCIGIGIVILAAGLVLGGHPGFYIDNSGIHSNDTPRKLRAIKDSQELPEFDSMEISLDYADLEMILSDQYAIEYCVETNGKKPVCEVQNGKLIFKESESKLNIIWGFSSITQTNSPDCYVKVYIPAGKTFSSLIFNIDDGDITLPDLKADTLSLSNDYGDISINSFEGASFSAVLDSGNLSAKYIQADTINLQDEYGDTAFKQIQSKALTAVLENGHFQTDRLDCTKTDIQNEYGDVTIYLPEDTKSYGLDLSTEYGRIQIDGQQITSVDDETKYIQKNPSGQQIKISCEDGNINLATK